MPCAIKLDLKGHVKKVQKPDEMSMLDFIYRECDCSIFEVVHAKGLKSGFFMAVDEEGLFKETPFINPFASWLYGYQKHGNPIVGKAMILKEVMTDDGMDSALLDDDEADLLIAWLNERREIMIRDIRLALLKEGNFFVGHSDNV